MSGFLPYVLSVLFLISFVLVIEISIKYIALAYYLHQLVASFKVKIIVVTIIESAVDQKYFPQQNEGWISSKNGLVIHSKNVDILEVVKSLFLEIKRSEK